MIKVYHAIKPNFGMGEHPEFNETNFELVAEINDDSSISSAFTMTQNLDRAWKHNAGVKAIKQECRSTSVGDVAVKDGKAHRCEMFGWSEIDQKEYFTCEDCGTKVNMNEVTDDGCPHCTG
jgi:rubrerythrin